MSSLTEQAHSSRFILRDNRDTEEQRAEEKEDIAQKRGQPRQGTESAETVETYLSSVESFLSDSSTRQAAQYECERLSEIAENASLPEPLRDRAAALREVARVAA